MKKKLALSALSFASVVTLTACGAAPSSSSSDVTGNEIGDTIKVGLNFELSGGSSAYGTAEKNAAELAIDEINAAGGVDGKKLEAVLQDNKSDNAESANITTKLVSQGKVNVIVGPAASSAVASAIPNASSAGVPLVTPSGTQDNLTVSDDGKVKEFAFRATFVDSYQGDVLAKYVTENMKAKKVVLYYDNSSDYAKGVADKFKDNYKGEIVVEETFSAGDTDFQAVLSKIKSKDYDAIVMPAYYEEAGSIIKQAREMGIKQPILGPDGFADATLVELAGADNVDDVYYISGFSASSSDKAKDFVKAYKAKYGQEPSMFAALSYDAVYMAAEASKDAKSSKDIATNLAKVSDFEGVTGKMTIDKSHNPVKSVSIIGLTDGIESSSTIVEAD